MDFEKRVQAAIREMIDQGLVESAHDLSDGGFAVALADSTFKNLIGARIEFSSELRPEFLLFHEAPSRILLSTKSVQQVEQIAKGFGVPAPRIGATIEGRLEVRNRETPLLDCDVRNLRQLWESALESRLNR